jgi:hypothetical protein
MKSTVFCLSFIFLFACQSSKNPTPSDYNSTAAKDTSLGMYIQKINIVKDTILGYQTQYTKIKKGKELALAKRCALHYLSQRHETLNDETRDYYNGIVSLILDQTCGIRADGHRNDPFLDFDLMNNKVYFTYITMAGWDIPIEEVEAYLE